MAFADLGRARIERRLLADEAARKRIAKALNLVELKALEARLSIAPWLDGAEVDGRWSATVVQICGVTLEPFETELSGDISVRAVPEGSPALSEEAEHELDLEPDGLDPPEAIQDGALPLGAYVVEALSLSIDPFPRKPGVRFEAETSPPDSSPFSVLVRLKDRERDA
jgi:hypothetical protein